MPGLSLRLELPLLPSAVAFLSSTATLLSVYFQRHTSSASFLLKEALRHNRQLLLVGVEEGVKPKHRLLGQPTLLHSPFVMKHQGVPPESTYPRLPCTLLLGPDYLQLNVFWVLNSAANPRHHRLKQVVASRAPLFAAVEFQTPLVSSNASLS